MPFALQLLPKTGNRRATYARRGAAAELISLVGPFRAWRKNTVIFIRFRYRLIPCLPQGLKEHGELNLPIALLAQGSVLRRERDRIAPAACPKRPVDVSVTLTLKIPEHTLITWIPRYCFQREAL